MIFIDLKINVSDPIDPTPLILASFKTLTSKPKPSGLFEQGLWLNLVNAVHGWQHHTDQDIIPDNTEVKWSQQQAQYQSRLQQIQIQTQPDEALIEVLDDYLKRILD